MSTKEQIALYSAQAGVGTAVTEIRRLKRLMADLISGKTMLRDVLERNV